MPTALFISPHLDDVAFSCGGLAAVLADRGWCTVLATVFTRSVPEPRGFALACQLDKGLPQGVDYMALRRAEDARAADILRFAAVHWLDLPEAPHRGYESAPALFAPIAENDCIGDDVSDRLWRLAEGTGPDLVLTPSCLGNHVDHHIVTRSVGCVFPARIVARYRDTPYALRAMPAADDAPQVVDISRTLSRKIAASAAYATQIGFQFGGAHAMEVALTEFAMREGGGVAAERFSGSLLPAV